MVVMSKLINCAGALLGATVVYAATCEKWKYHASLAESRSTACFANNSLPTSQVTPNLDLALNNAISVAKSTIPHSKAVRNAIEESQELCERVMIEHGLPGLVVGVTVNGKPVWSQGFGYADLENRVKMEPVAVIRIASISKSITMAMMAKLIEEGKVDIDCPIQTYIPNFPVKTYEGRKVEITTRHLLSHLSGIRHYKRKEEIEREKAKKKGGGNKNDNGANESEMNLKEYYLKDKFNSIEESWKLFQDDELIHEPGTKYLYSSHAWTVVAGIIEKVVDKPFPDHAKKMFAYWGLKNTFLDEHEPIIYNRSRYYTKHKKNGKLQNSPYVDNSYKWSGGGFLSSVGDLTQFANMLLFSYQYRPGLASFENGLAKLPYLQNSTVAKIWTGDPRTKEGRAPDLLYGLGFVIGEPMRNCMFCKERELMTVYHTGGAVGASSVLMLTFPKNWDHSVDEVDASNAPEVKGIAVAMITNLTDVGLSKTAQEIAGCFQALL